MIRNATPADVEALVKLGISSLEKDPYEQLVISEERIRETAVTCISSSNHFSWVCEHEGEITGAVVAYVADMFFYERKQASVIMFYCLTPGEGIKLIREFLRWARKRPIIKIIEFTLERNADPRISKLLTRLGVDLALPIHVQVK